MALFTASQGFRTLDFQSNSNTRVTTSVSGKTQRRKIGAQSWSLKLQSPAMEKADFMADFSFLVQQDGQFGSFTIVPPDIGSSRGTATGTITVVDDSSVDPAYNNGKGSKNIGVSGGSGTLKKGDLIKFSNHEKVYMITEDVNLDGSSVDVVSFYPPLVEDLGAATITYTNVPIKVYLDTDQIKTITQADGLYKYEIVINEDI